MFDFNGIWKEVLGEPEKSGIWLIWGAEKNGKTWFALILANFLSQFSRTHYVSAEEGMKKGFKDAIVRAKISALNKALAFNEYEPLAELYERLSKRKAPRIVVIDNITVYNNELKNGGMRKLVLDFPNTLFIFLAHEERGEPYTSTAKLCKRLADIIIHVEGLTCNVSGRCPGGKILIDEDRAALVYGNQILKRIS